MPNHEEPVGFSHALHVPFWMFHFIFYQS